MYFTAIVMPRSVLLLLCLHVAVCGVLTTVLNSTRSDVTDDAGSNNLRKHLINEIKINPCSCAFIWV